MLISGNVMIDKNHKEAPRNVSSEGGKGEEELVKGLKEWVEKVREGGGEGGSLLVMQISHPGRQSPMSVTSKPLAPSAVPLPLPFPGFFFFFFSFLFSFPLHFLFSFFLIPPIPPLFFPSLPGLLFYKPTELTPPQVEEIIEKYAICAERAKKAGWDGSFFFLIPPFPSFHIFISPLPSLSSPLLSFPPSPSLSFPPFPLLSSPLLPSLF